MLDGYYKEFITESINLIRNKDKKPTTFSIFNYVKTKLGECDLDLLKSSLETFLDDKIIETLPCKNDKSCELYCLIDNENADSNSDSKRKRIKINHHSVYRQAITKIKMRHHENKNHYLIRHQGTNLLRIPK